MGRSLIKFESKAKSDYILVDASSTAFASLLPSISNPKLPQNRTIANEGNIGKMFREVHAGLYACYCGKSKVMWPLLVSDFSRQDRYRVVDLTTG